MVPSWVMRVRSTASARPKSPRRAACVRVEPDVARLDVAVDDAALVGVIEAGADVEGDAQRLGHGQPVRLRALQERLHVAARHVLGHDVEVLALLPDVVDRDHVAVVAQAAHGLGLAAHAAHARLVEAMGLDHADRHLAIDHRVAGQVDALVGALAQQVPHLVAPRGERARAGLGRSGGGGRLRRGGHGAAAAGAEVRLGRQLPAALGAGAAQGAAALHTEARVGGVLALATGALHGVGSPLFYPPGRRGVNRGGPATPPVSCEPSP